MFGALTLGGLLLGQAQAEERAGANGQDAAAKVQLGIGGQFRVGQWTAVRIETPAERPAGTVRRLRLETLDGDGVEVAYVDDPQRDQTVSSQTVSSQTVSSQTVSSQTVSDPAGRVQWRYVVPGLDSAPLTIRAAGATGSAAEAAPLAQLRFPDASIAAERPWLVVVGSPLGLDKIGANELLGREAIAASTLIEKPQSLPDHWLGWEAVDVLLINGTSLEWLEALDKDRTEAILQWVRRGGEVLLTLGASGPEAIGASRLLRTLTGFSGEPLSLEFEPTAVEAYTSSRSPLASFAGMLLPTDQGQPLLIGRTVQRQPAPIAMEYRFGFGRVVAIAADLDQAPFTDWPQRDALIAALAPQMVPRESDRRRGGRSGEIAYTDLAGQVRATLDRFPASRTIPFSLAALILLGLLLLIGPLDYWLVNRWLGRAWVGWLSFPLVILLLSVGLIVWTRQGRQPVTINRLEMIDLDPRSGWGQAFTWAHLFSPQAGRWNIANQLDSQLTDDRQTPLLMSPFGYASPAFGGVQITDRRLPGYRIEVSRRETQVSSTWRGMPLAPVSSKGIAGWAQFSTGVSPPAGLVSFRGAELNGSLTNPLPFDLLDGYLLYDDWVYLLPTRFPAGSTIASVETLRQKNFRWHLTRRKALESASELEAWDPSEDADLDRLLDILAFYGAAGGQDYTTLSNHPLARLDLSGTLDNRQAILVGRLPEPAVALEIEAAGAGQASAGSEPPAGERPSLERRTLSLIRVMLPVADDPLSAN